MSRPEFLDWAEYYQMHPFDDLHRYHRPAAMVASAFGGASISERLDWLAPPPGAVDGHEYSEADRNTLKAFGFKPPRRKG